MAIDPEINRLSAEVERLKTEAKFDEASVEKQSLVIRQLRKALEDVRLFSVSHGLYAIIDLCDVALKDST